MNIAIKSEADSRMIVYPLLKVLIDFGSVALFTSNPFTSRLIEDEYEGGFRNIVVVPVTDGNLRAAMEEDEFTPGKYDFCILDNVGAMEYDYLLCVVTNHVSEAYVADIKLVMDEPGVHIVKFGKPAPKVKAPKVKTKKKGKVKDGEASQDEQTEQGPRNINDVLGEDASIDDIPDNEFNKWTVQETEADMFMKKLNEGTTKWCKFLTFEQIEELEARHTFFVPDDTTLKEIYRIFGTRFGIDERMFLKSGRLKDTSGTVVSGVDIS